MSPVEHLMLDAKQALLEEQHRKFKQYQQEGRWEEALQRFHATLSCASDLLSYSIQVLDQVIGQQKKKENFQGSPPASPSDPSTP